MISWFVRTGIPVAWTSLAGVGFCGGIIDVVARADASTFEGVVDTEPAPNFVGKGLNRIFARADAQRLGRKYVPNLS